MRVALGAWGLGSFLASHSEVWKVRFGGDPSHKGTLPPMSSLFSGMVEPFPFVLATKVFLDADQCDFLMSGGDSVSWNFSKNLNVLLKEVERASILAPISYRSLLQPKVGKLVELAERLLDSADLPSAAAESRRLWARFLRSPGGNFLPHLASELAIADQQQDFVGMIDLRSFPQLARAPVGRDRTSFAALACGHDVFDVVAMLSVASDLDAVLCD